jgi:hypothetical protein
VAVRRSPQCWSGGLAGPPRVVDRHLLRSVVIDGINSRGWTVLLSRGVATVDVGVACASVLDLQPMRLVMVVAVFFHVWPWWLLELADGGMMCGLVVAVLSSSSSPICVMSLVKLYSSCSVVPL